jgi:hypothetical protein
MWRKAEALRDKIMRGVGTDEPWFCEATAEESGAFGLAVHWRKPLRIDEVNQMAPIPEVRDRPGRS